MDETGRRYLSGINCTPELAQKSFMATKNLYGKASGTFFYQYVQSFSPKEEVTPVEAHQIAQELAERFFPGCEVLVATHIDAEHLHSHLIVNSVHPDTGKKLHFTPNTLEQMRKLYVYLLEHGLSTLKPYQQDRRTQGLRTGEYRAANRGRQLEVQLIITIEEAMKRAGTREEFLREMNQQGYQVRWEEGRKSITYTTPTGKKCRDDKLHELKFRKEQMEHEFRNPAASSTNSSLDTLKQRQKNSPTMPTLINQQANILYTMPLQTVERLEQVLRSTLALQENIRSEMDSLATKKSLEPWPQQTYWPDG